MLIDDSFRRFDGGDWVKKFNSSEENDMFLCAICTVFSFVTAANFSVTGVEYRLLKTFIGSVCATL